MRRHFQSEPGELCFGYVGEAQLGLEPESGREGGRLGSHILDLCSVSVIPDLVLWVSVWLRVSLCNVRILASVSLLGLGLGG